MQFLLPRHMHVPASVQSKWHMVKPVRMFDMMKELILDLSTASSFPAVSAQSPNLGV